MGYYGMTFDAECGNAGIWEIVPVQQTPEIQPGETWQTTSGGRCGDMELGERTLTATLYGADPAEVVDAVEVRFTLIE